LGESSQKNKTVNFLLRHGVLVLKDLHHTSNTYNLQHIRRPTKIDYRATYAP